MVSRWSRLGELLLSLGCFLGEDGMASEQVFSENQRSEYVDAFKKLRPEEQSEVHSDMLDAVGGFKEFFKRQGVSSKKNIILQLCQGLNHSKSGGVQATEDFLVDVLYSSGLIPTTLCFHVGQYNDEVQRYLTWTNGVIQLVPSGCQKKLFCNLTAALMLRQDGLSLAVLDNFDLCLLCNTIADVANQELVRTYVSSKDLFSDPAACKAFDEYVSLLDFNTEDVAYECDLANAATTAKVDPETKKVSIYIKGGA